MHSAEMHTLAFRSLVIETIVMAPDLHVPRLIASVGLFVFFALFGTVFFATYEDCSCSYGVTKDGYIGEGCTDTGADQTCRDMFGET